MEKTLTDKNGKEIRRGSIVRYRDGWLQINSIAVKNQTVNLSTIFGGRIVEKKVPLNEIYSDCDAWSKHWQESETYKCM